LSLIVSSVKSIGFWQTLVIVLLLLSFATFAMVHYQALLSNIVDDLFGSVRLVATQGVATLILSSLGHLSFKIDC
jgi:hypothetical protein